MEKVEYGGGKSGDILLESTHPPPTLFRPGGNSGSKDIKRSTDAEIPVYSNSKEHFDAARSLKNQCTHPAVCTRASRLQSSNLDILTLLQHREIVIKIKCNFKVKDGDAIS